MNLCALAGSIVRENQNCQVIADDNMKTSTMSFETSSTRFQTLKAVQNLVMTEMTTAALNKS